MYLGGKDSYFEMEHIESLDSFLAGCDFWSIWNTPGAEKALFLLLQEDGFQSGRGASGVIAPGEALIARRRRRTFRSPQIDRLHDSIAHGSVSWARDVVA